MYSDSVGEKNKSIEETHLLGILHTLSNSNTILWCALSSFYRWRNGNSKGQVTSNYVRVRAGDQTRAGLQTRAVVMTELLGATEKPM
jgi:hypothetical protein